jgi:hypothetical protein
MLAAFLQLLLFMLSARGVPAGAVLTWLLLASGARLLLLPPELLLL